MSATVYCTFDQQDIADLAIGKLKSSVQGIQAIQYLTDYGNEFVNRDDAPGLFTGWTGAYSAHVGIQPARPVSVKISCDAAVKDIVTARLVNLHAYKIVCS